LPGGGAAIAKILRTAGARTNIRDTYGMTALDYFEQNRKRASTYQQSAYEELWQILTAP
jgi:hypothetical protein